jgi:hypothetical protein
VGPIIDIQINPEEQLLCSTSLSRLGSGLPYLHLLSNHLNTHIYDSVIIIRPTCNFREGTVTPNNLLLAKLYLKWLPFNQSYLLALIHLLASSTYMPYRTTSSTSIFNHMLPSVFLESVDVTSSSLVIGSIALFLVITPTYL